VGGGKSEVVPEACFRTAFRFGAEVLFRPTASCWLSLLSCQTPNTQATQSKLALLRLDSDVLAPARLLELDQQTTGSVRFTPDGKAVAYPIEEKGVDNFWIQRLDGSPRRQITNFTSEQIDDFRWSRAGNTLAVTRSHTDSDVGHNLT